MLSVVYRCCNANSEREMVVVTAGGRLEADESGRFACANGEIRSSNNHPEITRDSLGSWQLLITHWQRLIISLSLKPCSREEQENVPIDPTC